MKITDPSILLSGTIAQAIVERNGVYFAWTRTWEGPARPDYAAAMADLRDHQATRHAAVIRSVLA